MRAREVEDWLGHVVFQAYGLSPLPRDTSYLEIAKHIVRVFELLEEYDLARDKGAVLEKLFGPCFGEMRVTLSDLQARADHALKLLRARNAALLLAVKEADVNVWAD